jgi:hypothetical protein
MREAQDTVHRGVVNANVVQQARGDIPIPRHHRPIALRSTITQVRGWMGDDPAPVVLHHLDRDGGTPNPRRNGREISPLIDAHGFDRTEVARRMALSMAGDGYRVAPGAWLAGQLMAGLVRNVTRSQLRSDMVDCFHAMHLPYVDIASCDAQAYSILSRVVQQATGPRPASVSLFRNKEDSGAVSTTFALPAAVRWLQRDVGIPGLQVRAATVRLGRERALTGSRSRSTCVAFSPDGILVVADSAG